MTEDLAVVILGGEPQQHALAPVNAAPPRSVLEPRRGMRDIARARSISAIGRLRSANHCARSGSAISYGPRCGVSGAGRSSGTSIWAASFTPGPKLSCAMPSG
jgi:hypothetical protein